MRNFFAFGCIAAGFVGLISGPQGLAGLLQPDPNYICWVFIGLVAYCDEKP